MNIELIKVVDILVKQRLSQTDINNITYQLVDSLQIKAIEKTNLLMDLHSHIKQVQQTID